MDQKYNLVFEIKSTISFSDQKYNLVFEIKSTISSEFHLKNEFHLQLEMAQRKPEIVFV